MLQYPLGGGHRISVYVFDPRRIATLVRVHPRMVIGSRSGLHRSRARLVGRRRRTPRRGLRIASDLDDDESAELALAAARTETASFQASVGTQAR